MKRGSHICHYIHWYQQCCLEKTPPAPRTQRFQIAITHLCSHGYSRMEVC